MYTDRTKFEQSIHMKLQLEVTYFHIYFLVDIICIELKFVISKKNKKHKTKKRRIKVIIERVNSSSVTSGGKRDVAMAVAVEIGEGIPHWLW